ncbi:MAG: response regulator transcription factor [Actinobacteria bacterium]|nr:response regulator transcription factor [Actinomycetota bacterium]
MRVLIVEDELRLATYVKRGLEAEGFTVDVALDGEEGLERALTEEYDIITLDIMLPGMNGYKVCEQLRANDIWTPILMLTAKDGEYDEAEALDMGADDFLRKPFSFVVLLARIRALLRRGKTERNPVLTVGSLSLDPSSRTVTKQGSPIELTPREFSLLEYLMHNKSDVLSKRQIIDHVWDWGYDGDENIVEVYMGYLRKKIDTPFEAKTLQTVRGIGYRLLDDTVRNSTDA